MRIANKELEMLSKEGNRKQIEMEVQLSSNLANRNVGPVRNLVNRRCNPMLNVNCQLILTRQLYSITTCDSQDTDIWQAHLHIPSNWRRLEQHVTNSPAGHMEAKDENFTEEYCWLYARQRCTLKVILLSKPSAVDDLGGEGDNVVGSLYVFLE